MSSLCLGAVCSLFAPFLAELVLLAAFLRCSSASDIPEDWSSPVGSSNLHFRSLGRMIGSVNFAHLQIIVDLPQIQRSIQVHCSGPRQALKMDNVKWRDKNEILSQLLLAQLDRCESILEEFYNVVNAWVTSPIDWEGRPILPTIDDSLSTYAMGSHQNSHTTAEEDRYLASQDTDIRLQIDPSSRRRSSGSSHGSSKSSPKTPKSLGRFRGRRQLIGLAIVAAVTIATNLFNRAQMISLASSTKADVDHVVHILQDHETRLAVANKSSHLLSLAYHELTGNVKNMGETTAQLILALQYATSTDELALRTNALIHSLDLLSRHRLSPRLVSSKDLDPIIRSLRAKTDRQGLHLISEQPSDVFRCETSHILMSDGKLLIFVHLPAFKDDGILEVFSYAPLPLPLPGSDNFILPNPAATVLAINPLKTLFKTMTTSELKDCSLTLGLFYCKNQNLYHRTSRDDCLMALHDTDVRRISDNCPLLPNAKSESILQLNSSHFLIYQALLGPADITCGDSSQKSTMFQGLRLFHVPPTCRASTKAFIFDGQDSVFGDTLEVKFRTFNVSLILSPSALADLSTMSSVALDELTSLSNDAGMTVRDIEGEFASRRSHTALLSGSLAFILFILLAIALLFALRARSFFNRRRIHQRQNAHLPPVMHFDAQMPIA